MGTTSNVVSFSATISNATGVINSSARSYQDTRWGPAGDFGYVGQSVNPNYVIIIRSQQLMCSVRALLQDKFTMKATSEWRSVFGGGRISSRIQEGIQYLTGRALVNKLMSRRIWSGTSPLTFTIPLKFEALDDALSEVFLPCLKLEQMVLPTQFDTNSTGEVAVEGQGRGLLNRFSVTPPGPSPYEDLPGWKDDDSRRKGSERISVSIGNLVNFPNVIMREVTIDLANKFTEEGHPVSGTANIVFETYTMLTKEDVLGGEEAFASTKGRAENSSLVSAVLSGSEKYGVIAG